MSAELKADVERAAKAHTKCDPRDWDYETDERQADLIERQRAALLAFFHSREPGAEEVEAVAQAIYDDRYGKRWGRAAQNSKFEFIRFARAALKAQAAWIVAELEMP